MIAKIVIFIIVAVLGCVGAAFFGSRIPAAIEAKKGLTKLDPKTIDPKKVPVLLDRLKRASARIRRSVIATLLSAAIGITSVGGVFNNVMAYGRSKADQLPVVGENVVVTAFEGESQETEETIPKGTFKLPDLDWTELNAWASEKFGDGVDNVLERARFEFSNDCLQSMREARVEASRKAMREYYLDDDLMGFSDPVWFPPYRELNKAWPHYWCNCQGGENISPDELEKWLDRNVQQPVFQQILRNPTYCLMWQEWLLELPNINPDFAVLVEDNPWLPKAIAEINEAFGREKDPEGKVPYGLEIYLSFDPWDLEQSYSNGGSGFVLNKKYMENAAYTCMLLDMFDWDVEERHPVSRDPSIRNWHMPLCSVASLTRTQMLADPEDQETEPCWTLIYRYKNGKNAVRGGVNCFDGRAEILGDPPKKVVPPPETVTTITTTPTEKITTTTTTVTETETSKETTTTTAPPPDTETTTKKTTTGTKPPPPPPPVIITTSVTTGTLPPPPPPTETSSITTTTGTTPTEPTYTKNTDQDPGWNTDAPGGSNTEGTDPGSWQSSRPQVEDYPPAPSETSAVTTVPTSAETTGGSTTAGTATAAPEQTTASAATDYIPPTTSDFYGQSGTTGRPSDVTHQSEVPEPD